ncbi:general secretion pathway protein GspB [Marinicella meishanensis]|uniref:general secretion pathway protein GspB n=1 Tax=Marinicella meishanensis TaxID=2873263 RepID=UPI001CBFDF44|nr:general secretion pathway protein GspB [Marinicella sp. NBU2979]
MSSIIDALKKSAQNRSSQQESAANTINFSQESPPQSRRGFWLLVLLLLLVVGGLLAWQQGWHHAVMAQAQSWLGSTPEQPAAATQTNEPTEPPAARPGPTAKPATPPTTRLTPPKAAEVKAQSAAEKSRNDTPTTTAEQATQSNPEPAAERPPAVPSEPVAEDTITVVENRNSSETETAPETPTEEPAADDRMMLQPQLQQDYLLIHQIDFAIRKNIPPIKLNIHIFDPDPDKRMVILNGVKFLTGDVIEELVTVDEIVKEGVVLKFENIRFLVPK